MRIAWYIAAALLPVDTAFAQPTLDTAISVFENRDEDAAGAVITEEIALERSVGQILLHVGDGFSPVGLELAAERLADVGFPVSIYRGGPEGLIQVYMFGNRFPPEPYSYANTPEMTAVVTRIGRENGLIE